MKKTITIILACILFVSCAFAESNEITFKDIPWLSDDAFVFHALLQSDLVRDSIQYLNFGDGISNYIIKDDSGFISPGTIMNYKDVCKSADLSGIVKGKIAGYPIKNLILTFAYDGTYKLIDIEIELVMADYNELRQKIANVYGEGETMETEEDDCSIIWKGENNSSILLYTQDGGKNYTFIYGRLDTEDILKKCLVFDINDIGGL